MYSIEKSLCIEILRYSNIEIDIHQNRLLPSYWHCVVVSWIIIRAINVLLFLPNYIR